MAWREGLLTTTMSTTGSSSWTHHRVRKKTAEELALPKLMALVTELCTMTVLKKGGHFQQLPLKKWVEVYVQKNAEVVKNVVQLMLAPKMTGRQCLEKPISSEFGLWQFRSYIVTCEESKGLYYFQKWSFL